MHFRLRLVHYYAFIVLSLHSYKVNCFLQNFNILFHLMPMIILQSFYSIHSQRRAFAFLCTQRNLPAERTAFHIFRRIAQPVGSLVEIGPVNLVGITEKYNLCVLPRPGDDSFYLIRRLILAFFNNSQWNAP